MRALVLSLWFIAVTLLPLRVIHFYTMHRLIDLPASQEVCENDKHASLIENYSKLSAEKSHMA